LKAGIRYGLALEIGPGYLKFEWLKRTTGTHLQGLDISPDKIKIAERNAKEFGLEDRDSCVESDARKMPFEDNTFDAAFTNGSLHQGPEPRKIFNAIYRVLKPKGKYCISDLCRDMNPVAKWFMKLMIKPKEIRLGLVSSINASYAVDEIQEILKETKSREYETKKNICSAVLDIKRP